jgi:hypothetical protein
MIRQLAQCPYCQACEIALDDEPELVFNPDADRHVPCPHLAWVDGRYAQWERTPHGVNREIGSIELRWDPPEPGAEERSDRLLDYLRELANNGPGWPFAPAEPFALQPLSADEKALDPRGHAYTLWDVDGWAVFAQDPAAFWAALPACQEKQLAGLEVEEGDEANPAAEP